MGMIHRVVSGRAVAHAAGTLRRPPRLISRATAGRLTSSSPPCGWAPNNFANSSCQALSP